MPKRVAVIRTLLYVGDEDRVHETLRKSKMVQGPPNNEVRELCRQDVTLDMLSVVPVPSVSYEVSKFVTTALDDAVRLHERIQHQCPNR